METKSELRKRILKLRNNMNKEEVLSNSKIIMDKLRNLSEFKNSKTVFIYMDFKNEVITRDLIEEMLEEKKHVVIPYTDTANVKLIPTEIFYINQDLEKCSFGYYEPKGEIIKCVETEKFDLIVVPGVAFDKNLNRLGFGKGYYDRILSLRKRDCKAIAVAHDFQVLSEIPSEEHDIKMDMIITEKNIY
jgi:5-formyltetrahydrofolate cyclo-ligase